MLVVTVLGPLTVAGASGVALGELESRFHVKALLGLLATTPETIERDVLLATLWPMLPASAARNRLHHTVHLLRQSLEQLSWPADWVMSSGGRLWLDAALWSDARCVVQAARRVDAGTLDDPALHAALHHCNESWMPDLALGEAGERCRIQLRAQQAMLVREAARRLSGAGDTPPRRELLARLQRIQPTDEWACQQLMSLDLAAGRPNGALKIFQALKRELAERLGLRAGAATLSLAARAEAMLAAGAAPPAPAWPRAEPPPGPPWMQASDTLLGRTRELEDLVRCCRIPGSITNLCGIGGAGRSTLAACVARRLAHEDGDSVVWVDLSDPAAHDGPLAVCARALGLCESHDAQVLAQSVVAHLRRQRLLLVLDDADGAQAMADLLPALLAAPATGALQASVLVVTRQPLDHPAAQVMAIGGLALPEADLPVDQADRFASVALFRLRSPTLAASGAADDLADIIRLVRRLDGLPLAIELAAARTASMTPREILERIDASLLALRPDTTAGSLQAGPQRSMQAALWASVRALSPAAAALFRRLAVFPGTFTVAEVVALASACATDMDTAAEADTERTFTELQHSGLVVAAADGRLSLLHLPRVLALELAHEAGELQDLWLARLETLIAELSQLDLGYESPHFETGMQRLAVLHDEAVAIVQGSQAYAPQRAALALVPLARYWLFSGSTQRPLAWLPPLLDEAQPPLPAQVAMHLHLLLATARRGQLDAARTLAQAEAAEALARQQQDTDAIVHAVCLQADALAELGDAGRASARLSALVDTFGLVPGRRGYWRWRLYPFDENLRPLLQRPPLADRQSLPALRREHAGSALWLDLLSELCREATAAGDAELALTAADEQAAAGQRLGNPLIEARGVWERLWHELALDRLDACAASARRLRHLWHRAGDDLRALTVALVSLEVAWRRGELDAAALALADARAVGARAAPHTFDVDLALHGAMVRALRDKAEGRIPSVPAWQAWREIAARAAELPMPQLFLACEVGLALHALAGRAASVAALGVLLRGLDPFNESTPLVRRCRDRWMAAGEAAPTPAVPMPAASPGLPALAALLLAAAQASDS